VTVAFVPPPPRTAVDLEPGMHPGIEPEVYYARALGLVRKSVLDLVHRSPAHLKAWLDGGEEEPTPALAFGVALHTALLEPDRFAHEYVVAPDFGDRRYKAAKERYEGWKAENVGKTVLEVRDGDAIRGITMSVLRHPLLGRIVERGRSEMTVRWDEECGLPAAARLDKYLEELAVTLDLKSTEDASPGAFSRSVANYRYHVQEAHYRAGLDAIGATCEHFIFGACEKRPPYAVALYELSPEALAVGERVRRRDIQRLEECAVKNEWPGYPEAIVELDLPRWAQND
jgi:hypothetical protein